jgi:hypothetical protein
MQSGENPEPGPKTGEEDRLSLSTGIVQSEELRSIGASDPRSFEATGLSQEVWRSRLEPLLDLPPSPVWQYSLEEDVLDDALLLGLASAAVGRKRLSRVSVVSLGEALQMTACRSRFIFRSGIRETD